MTNTKHFFAILCASIGGFLDIYSTQAIYPVLHARFGIGPSRAGALITVTTLGIAISAPFTASLIKKTGTRISLLSSLMALAILWIFMSQVSGWSALMFIRLLQGFAISAALSSLLAGIHDQYSGFVAVQASAIYVIGTVLGGTLGRYLPAALIPSLDWVGSYPSRQFTFSCGLVCGAS